MARADFQDRVYTPAGSAFVEQLEKVHAALTPGGMAVTLEFAEAQFTSTTTQVQLNVE